jgi:hypothetical protein
LHTSLGKQSASDELHFKTQIPLLQREFGPHSWTDLHFWDGISHLNNGSPSKPGGQEQNAWWFWGKQTAFTPQ